MIDRQEIMDFSREFGLSANVIEKDYVLGWILDGLSKQREVSQGWMFKGGTCLKKCYFETYRFSEDLDFTLDDDKNLNKDFLTKVFNDLSDGVYDKTGIEIPKDRIRVDIYDNPRGSKSATGKISYRGPMQKSGDLPTIKFDLTADELVVLEPVARDVHHPYSDKPSEGMHVQCYCFEELFAEKIRALAERLRPRDLYDVISLFRRQEFNPDRTVIMETLREKCAFKDIAVPTFALLSAKEEYVELVSEWENMLGHQLPELPPFEQFWSELPALFEWLSKTKEKGQVKAIAVPIQTMDLSWRTPAMAQAWHENIPLETIRFAAANRLCVNLKYNGSSRLIEPYSLRRTKDGHLLMYAVKHNTGEDRSYRVDRIQGVSISKVPFIPRYAIEMTETGPLSVLPIARKRRTIGRNYSHRFSISKSSHSPVYVVECSHCGKHFRRKSYHTTLKPHKDKSGYPCMGRSGTVVETKF